MNAYASKLGNDADQYEVVQEGTGKTLAVTHDDEGGKRAALYAAAPDLLAACMNLVVACELTDDAYYDAIDTAMNIVRAAIAKAKPQ